MASKNCKVSKTDSKTKTFFIKILRFIYANFQALLVFALFVLMMVLLGSWYSTGLYPSPEMISKVIEKFTIDDYSLPYHVAERYLMYLWMRTYFFILHYVLTLVSILASLMTVFYASKKKEKRNKGKNSGSNHTGGGTVIFLSLLSLFFSIASIFINPGSKANMSQYAWRELDVCITKTIHETHLTDNEKNKILAEKISEIEYYIESFEN